MSNVTISVTGYREIDKVLKQLPQAMSEKVLYSAHSKAGKIVAERERGLAPEGPTGSLVDSIGVVKGKGSNAKSLGLAVVGPRRRGKFKGYHAHLVEFGTTKRETKKGANRGYMPKKPFAQPAFDQTKSQVERQIQVELGKALLRVMKKNVK